MAKQPLPINLSDMQSIIDLEERNYHGGLIDFYQHCCNIYNKRNNPAKPLYGQIIYNHVKKNNLKTNFVSNKRKTLTPDHIKKMQQGRRRDNAEAYEGEIDDQSIKHADLFKIVDEVNKTQGTDYKLEIHNNFGQVARTGYSGPCLSMRHLKIFLLGLTLAG